MLKQSVQQCAGPSVPVHKHKLSFAGVAKDESCHVVVVVADLDFSDFVLVGSQV